MKKAVPYILVVAVFLLLASNRLLTRGMFCDGVVYTAIASNYAHGIGSFWEPRFTETINGNPPPLRGVAVEEQPAHTQIQGHVFYAHPALMMVILSVWMRLFGTGIIVAKLYSLAIMLLTALLMVRLWRRLGFGRETGWLPLLLWLLIPPVTHFSCYNMLEPTMLVFILGAILCVLREGRHEWAWHLLAGGFLFLAFLTKEFTGLFPLVLPAVLWLTKMRDHSFGRMVALTAWMLAGLLLPCAIVFAFVPGALPFFEQYFNIQIMGQAVHGYDHNRLRIVGHFFLHSGIAMTIVAIVLLVRKAKLKGDWCPPTENLWTAVAMFIFALCGVLPLMVSAKASDYFLLTAFPFFSISMAALLEPWAESFGDRLGRGRCAAVVMVLLVAAVVLNVVFAGRPGRDEVCQEDLAVIAPHLDEGEVVTMPGEVFDDYYELTLAGYYYIDRRVSLDSNDIYRHVLTTESAGLGKFADTCEAAYRRVDIPTKDFVLYERTTE